MAFDLPTVRGAIANQVATNVTRAVNVFNGYMPENPLLPAVIVQPDDDFLIFHETFSRTGIVTAQFRIRLFADPGPGMDGQIVIDEMLSTGTSRYSVVDALMADQAFGGAVSTSALTVGKYDGRVVWGQPDGQNVADAAHIVLLTQTNP